jgi:uncharacterized delta-60 repeat protein
MAQIDLLAFEMPRRPVRFYSQTILPTGLPMNYTKNPNDAILGDSDGDDLVYNSPFGTFFQMDDGTYYYKKATPNVWEIVGSGTGGGTVSGATNGITLNSGIVRLGGTLTGSTVFIDDRSTKLGLQYAGDYSSSFDARSLIDKGYADAIVSGLKPKQAVLVATTTDIDLITGGLITIDGIPLSNGDRVLVKNQISGETNGVYIASASTWTRATDFDGSPFGEVVSGSYMWVLTGNTNANTSWVLATPDPVVIDVTPLQFVFFNHVMDVVSGIGIDVVMSGGTHIINLNANSQAVVNSAITGATNGLSVVGKNIILGGALTGDTYICTDSGSFNVSDSGTNFGLNIDMTGGGGVSLGKYDVASSYVNVQGSNVDICVADTIDDVFGELYVEAGSASITTGGATGNLQIGLRESDDDIIMCTKLGNGISICGGIIDSINLQSYGGGSLNLCAGSTTLAHGAVNIVLSGSSVDLTGAVKLHSTPASGLNTDEILVWNFTDKIIKSISGDIINNALTGATNGLTKSGRDVMLGGALSQNTNISGNTYGLSICSGILNIESGSTLNLKSDSTLNIDYNRGIGKVLTSDAYGNANWTCIPVLDVTNGLTNTNSIGVLGGELIQETQIDLNSNYFKITNQNPPFIIGSGFELQTVAMDEQPDGKIVVGGDFISYSGVTKNKIVRLNPDGSIDNTFNIGGTGFSTNYNVRAVVIQPDGKIVVGGGVVSGGMYYNGSVFYGIIRLNSDGSIDNSFSYTYGILNAVYRIIVQNDGKILLGGSFTGGIIRLNSDGTVDSSFVVGAGFTGGFVSVRVVWSMAEDTDGTIVIGGNFTYYKGISSNSLIRLNPDGSINQTFGTNFNENVVGITLDNGKIVAVGKFSGYSGQTHYRIIRLLANGNIDTTFDTGGGITGVLSGTLLPTIVKKLINGKYVVLGYFTSYDGNPTNAIVRINPDGSYDPTFDTTAGGFAGGTNNLHVSKNGKYYVVGNFTTYNGVTTNRIVRINYYGEIDNTSLDSEIIFNGKVIEYGDNYSSLYTDRSLVDKEYVDDVITSSITVNNGLTKLGNNIVLGGNLTGATTINLSDNGFRLQSDNTNIYGLADFGLNSTYSNSKFGICSRDAIGSQWGLSGNSSSISTYHCTNNSNGSCISVNNTGIEISNKVSSAVKSVNLGVSGLTYGANYHSNYSNRSLVDKEYVDTELCATSNVVNVCQIGSGYYVQRYDDLIAVSGLSTAVIYLDPSPVIGQRVSVVDICGNALADPIMINGYGKNINDGATSTINTDYGSVTFVFNGIFWSAIAFVN